MLQGALNNLTNPGGQFAGHQDVLVKTFKGQANTFKDHVQDIMAGFGGLANQFAMPVMKMFNLVDPNSIQDFFDKWKGAAQTAGEKTAKFLKDGFQWVLDNKDKLVAAGQAIVGAFIALKTIQLGAGFVGLISNVASLGGLIGDSFVVEYDPHLARVRTGREGKKFHQRLLLAIIRTG